MRGEPAKAWDGLRDAEGYLLDPADWSEDFARIAAGEEGIELTEEHWSVVRFMRAWQEHHQVSPDARFAMKHLTAEFGAPRNRLFELFPYGYVKQACKIAGMRRPRVWSTG
ncbi:MAG: TusE/DsrC/DsvC family sulfur relay protein [Siculibacillus sp.]|nr:TusE/DsrC/DsvC family sulfur relay protein [Siculibacillus sp.]